MTSKEYKLIAHSYSIADTGDFDGHYEITNGKVSIFTKDDDEEALKVVVNALNNSGVDFFLSDEKYVEGWMVGYDKGKQDERKEIIEKLRVIQERIQGEIDEEGTSHVYWCARKTQLLNDITTIETLSK